MTLAALRPGVDPDAVLRGLGFEDDDLETGDHRDAWNVSRVATGAELKSGTSFGAVQRLNTLWPGGYLTAEVQDLGVAVFDLAAVANAADLATRLAGLHDDREYDLVVVLDKQRLLVHEFGEQATLIRWFVSGCAFGKFAEQPYYTVEGELFPSAGSESILVVPGDIELVGAHLKVVGGTYLAGTNFTFTPSTPPLDASLEDRRKELNSAGTFARQTPDRFIVEGDGWTHPAAPLIARLLFHGVAMFTADRVRYLPDVAGTITARFTGPSGTVSVDVGPALVIDEPGRTAEGAADVLAWIFGIEPQGSRRRWVDERLDLARMVIYDQLRRTDPADRAARMAQLIHELPGDLEWHWRLFLSNQIEEHTAALRDFRATVTTTVTDYAARAAGVTSGLIDAMKAAVATVLASFIASALSSSFDKVVFRIGMLTYATYVIVFACIFGLYSSYVQFRAAEGTYAASRGAAVDVLGEKRVKVIEGDAVSRSRSAYRTAFVSAIAVYIVVVLAAIVAAVVVPDLVEPDDPEVVGSTAVELELGGTPVELAVTGLGDATTLRLAAEQSGPPSAHPAAGASAVAADRTNRCLLDDAEAGDAALLSDPGASGRTFVLLVESSSATTVDLDVVHVQGKTGLGSGNEVSGCELIGRAGEEWVVPGWLTDELDP